MGFGAHSHPWRRHRAEGNGEEVARPRGGVLLGIKRGEDVGHLDVMSGGGMKILHVLAGYPSRPGFGVSRYASELAQALSDLGHENHLASSKVVGGGNALKRDEVVEHGIEAPYPFAAYDEYLQAALEDLPLAEKLAGIW